MLDRSKEFNVIGLQHCSYSPSNTYNKMSDQASDLEGVREETKSTVDPIKSFLSGGFGGIACVLVGHPFDLTYVARLSNCRAS